MRSRIIWMLSAFLCLTLGVGRGQQVTQLAMETKIQSSPLPKNLRIDSRRLMSKLLDIFNIGTRINGGMAVRAALAAQFQYT
jgi:hypothetical protein